MSIVGRPLAQRLHMHFAESGWQALLDASVDGMIVIDGKGTIKAFNPSAERIFGYPSADVVGRNVSMLMPSPDRERHDDYLARYLRTGTHAIIGVGRDVTALRRDGSLFPAHLSVGEMRVAEEPHFVGIVHDLTARTALEERIREQAALARIGEMAAVLAHEVRNPLAAVGGAIQVLGRQFRRDSQEATVVQDVLARLNGLNELVQDLLLFARTPQPRFRRADLRAILTSVGDLLASDPLFRHVAVEIVGDGASVEADPELLGIVFQNLLINAAQAMEGSGTVTVSLSDNVDRQTVVVGDTGPGMSSEVRAQLFKPFFTTKARGTGLGLATVLRLVDAHRGTVTIDCPPGGGTLVRVELPTSQPAMAD